MIARVMEWLLIVLIIGVTWALCGYSIAACIANQEIEPKTWTNPGIISQKLRKWRMVIAFLSALSFTISSIWPVTLWWLRFVAYAGFAFWILTDALWAYRYLRAPGEKLPTVTLYARRVCWAAGFFVAVLVLLVILHYGFEF